MYRLGINYTSSAGITVDEAFEMFADIGFDAVFTMMPQNPDKLENHANSAAKNGLLLESVHAPFDGINDIWSDGQNGDIMEKRLFDCIAACGKNSVSIAVLHLSSGENAPCVCDAGRRRFDRLVEAAVKNNVIIAFENQRKLANLAFVSELYGNVKNVGFCWDVGHEKCFAHGREYMPLFGKKLVYTHIHDNLCTRNEDMHLIPFDGKINFHTVAAHIAASGFSGTLTLECLPEKSGLYTGVSPRGYYEKAYAAACKLRGMCVSECEKAAQKNN